MSLNVRDIYKKRFTNELSSRNDVWSVICKEYLQPLIPEGSVLLDLGAGYCEFINNIRAKKKIAADLNTDMLKHAGPDVECLIGSSTSLKRIKDSSVDVVFTSNFLEHLEKKDILSTLEEIQRILKVGGKLILIQPNIRYCYKDYWMFFDHLTPLDHRSIAEVLMLNGFKIIKSIPKFLPYTTKSSYPKFPSLVRLYLSLPVLWFFFGKQMLVVAEKEAD
ncbi:MAG: class I SAM-dependent methyltransferase [Candidatus Altiarchaeota archaeon]|nr:class I SAM-dependent methyltransferase [Candidatus Altiarchaeota archaeon]